MTTPVLCALRGASETRVVTLLSGAPGVEVVRRCADLTELLASGAAGVGRVAVVSADLPGLDRAAVEHLHASGVLVVAVGDPRTGWPAERVQALGVDAVLPPDALDDVTGLVLSLRPTDRTGAHRGAEPAVAVPPSGGAGVARVHAGAGRADATAGTAGLASLVDRPPAPERGTLVAVWGPTGAPGRTTIALNLAAELAELDRQGALLVDADTYGGTIAQLLGMLDEAPGIAAAARAASTGRLDPAALAALTPVLDGGLRVLTGLARADRWPELPSASLEAVWSAARRLSPWTVVDCGFSLEQDEALVYDTRAPRRNAATLSALAEADAVLVVGGGDPIGLQRLIRGLGDLTDVGVPAASRRVVVNRVRATASGPRPAEAITDALRRYAGVTGAHLVPDDREACDGAVLAARTLREHAPGSPARRAIAALVGALVGAGVAGRVGARAH